MNGTYTDSTLSIATSIIFSKMKQIYVAHKKTPRNLFIETTQFLASFFVESVSVAMYLNKSYHKG